MLLLALASAVAGACAQVSPLANSAMGVQALSVADRVVTCEYSTLTGTFLF